MNNGFKNKVTCSVPGIIQIGSHRGLERTRTLTIARTAKYTLYVRRAFDHYSGVLTDEAHQRLGIMDATRISDGRVVVLKKVNKHNHPYEAEIG